MGFISTWKRNAVHNLKPFQSPSRRGWLVFLRGSLHVDVCPGPAAHLLVLKLKNTRSHFEWYSFYLLFIIPSLWAGSNAFADMEDWGYGTVTAEPPQSWASQKLLALALGCSNDQALWAAVLPQKPRVFMWLFLQQMTVFQYFELLFVSLDLQVTEDVGSFLVYCSLSHFHMTFYWRPKHFFGRVLDSTFFLN